MNKIKVFWVVAALSLLLCGCAGSQATEPEVSEGPQQEETVEQVEPEQAEEEGSSDLVDVDEGLFEVTITVGPDFVGEVTQEELDASVQERGFKSATLNEDGSVTYVMTRQKHREFLSELSASFDESLAEMIGSEDYPSFVSIEHNDDFTSFTVTMTSTELGFTESFSVFNFYILGGFYTSFEGEMTDNVHVDFVNADSGEVISTWDSRDME